MKKGHQIVLVILWVLALFFIGGSLYQLVDYRRNPGVYAVQSAPWYTSMLIRGIIIAVVVLAVLLVLLLLYRWKKKRK